MDKRCKSYEQKTTFSRAKGQEIGQVFLAITHYMQGALALKNKIA